MPSDRLSQSNHEGSTSASHQYVSGERIDIGKTERAGECPFFRRELSKKDLSSSLPRYAP